MLGIRTPPLARRAGFFQAKKDTHLLLTGRDALAQTLWLQHFANKNKNEKGHPLIKKNRTPTYR